MDVHILWHVSHARNLDGSPVEHRVANGELLIDEEFDNVKIIGVYSDDPSVQAAIGRARLREGFRDEPDCFMSDRYTLDEDNWTDGFVTIPRGSE
jgi:hypothetical protein